MIDKLCATHKWPIISKEIQADHVHLFLTIPPAKAVADAVKILKGATARQLFLKFPSLRRRLWGGHLWSPSYYVGTAGNVSAETIKRYIERSAHIDKRR
jgi:putative transposase